MTVPYRLCRAIFAVVCSVMASGCFPSGRGSLNEEREPHFLNGRSLVNAMDYRGAIRAFGKALEVNPHSAAAHFELGWLYADKASDPAAAIFHYQRYLELRPGAENAETVGQHVFRLKQELAKAVLPMPSTPGIQRDFEQLAQENRALREEVERLRAALSGRATATNLAQGQVNREAQISLAGSTPQAVAAPPIQAASQSRQTPSGTATTRTHKVQSGETPYSIAHKYQVKVDALLSANPGLEARRMQVGRMLNIPGS
jgi:LysM repeat protein